MTTQREGKFKFYIKIKFAYLLYQYGDFVPQKGEKTEAEK